MNKNKVAIVQKQNAKVMYFIEALQHETKNIYQLIEKKQDVCEGLNESVTNQVANDVMQISVLLGLATDVAYDTDALIGQLQD